MSQVRAQLQQIQTLGGTAKEQTDRCKELLATILGQPDESSRCEQLRSYLECIIHENVSLVISRQLLNEIAAAIALLSPVASRELSQFALEKIQPRAVSFEEQVGVIRKHLAALHEADGQWRTAADILVRRGSCEGTGEG